MKYIILASLLSSVVLTAPLAQPGNANANTGGNAQVGAGKQAGQASQAAQQQGQAGQAAQAAQAGQTGQTQTGQAQNGQQSQNLPTAGQTAQGTPSDADLATAVSNWMADTSMVSNFLNTGKGITNNVAFKQAATVAFNAEVDELTHKAIIEQSLGNDPNVQAANSTLVTGGAFQDVVDKLQLMSQQGLAAVDNIDLINQNRCTNVLPNIDAYMAATGSQSRAVRPQVCDQNGIKGGVQSLGATQPGGTPGTPQQAFDAAAALANGTGNGITPTQTGAQGTAGTQQGAGAQQGTGAAQQGTATAQQGTQGTAGAQTQGQQGGAAAQQSPAAAQQSATAATGQTAGGAGAAAASSAAATTGQQTQDQGQTKGQNGGGAAAQQGAGAQSQGGQGRGQRQQSGNN